MSIWVKTLPVFLVLTLAFPSIIEARSGCCSHHDGVCGCGCCDGTSLSSTCAPYYPQCNGGQREIDTQPKRQIIATPTSTFKKVPTQKKYQTSSAEVVNSQKSDDSDGSGLGALAVLSGLGYGGYKIYKGFSKKSDEK